jgi:hypothetical protein
MIEGESQTVLNNVTEHNFQDAFKKWHHRERYICVEGDNFEGNVGQQAQS